MHNLQCSVLFFLLAAMLGGTRAAAQHKKPRPETVHYLAAMPDTAAFLSVAGAPLSGKLEGVSSVKIVYDLHARKLYFVQSARYRYHYNFCYEVLFNHEDLSTFNASNYGDPPRREYLLANLNWYRQSGRYALEFTSDDKPATADIAMLQTAIATASYLPADSVRLLISSGYLYALDSSHHLSVPRIYPADLYAGQHYQLLNEGTAYGYLRLAPQLSAAADSIAPEDIVVTTGTPAVVPQCAGIITNVFQTPLSHINVLCHNRNIPAAASLSVWSIKDLKALEGRPVKLSVLQASLILEPATVQEVSEWQAARPKPALHLLKADTSRRSILRSGNFRLAENNSIGNKAAGLGELNFIARKNRGLFYVPEGSFAIPFWFYQQHLRRPAVAAAIALLDSAVARHLPQAALAPYLKAIRSAIKKETPDAGLLDAVRAQMAESRPGQGFRFRSSSNAEDMDGFSGAGLYDSKTGILNDSARPPERAIVAVWASAWNDVAWQERRSAGIEERTMMMGILAHHAFPDEEANGVAITRNLYRQGFPGFTVNVQPGEVSVVAPPADTVVAEQYVSMEANEISPLNAGVVADYITFSSLTGGRPVLSPGQVAALHKALARIKAHYYYRYETGFDAPEYVDFALDLEFKFSNDGTLYIKQARPYR